LKAYENEGAKWPRVDTPLAEGQDLDKATIIIKNKMDKLWVLHILKLVLMRFYKEMQDNHHGLYTLMNHLVLNTTHTEFLMLSNCSQPEVSVKVEHSSKYSVPGLITNLSMVLFLTVNLETQLYVHTTILQSDLFAQHLLLRMQTPNLTLKCLSMVLIGPTLTSHLRTSMNQQ
jgi:hypothetical protein